MAETSIDVLDRSEIDARVEQGLLQRLDSVEEVMVIDCGDDRPLTDRAHDIREARYGRHVMPARHFGGASGLALSALNAMVMSGGEQQLRQFGPRLSAEAFTEFAIDLADRGHATHAIDINHHSDDKSEGHHFRLGDPALLSGQLGCKFIVAVGGVVGLATTPQAGHEARAIGHKIGTGIPVRETVEALEVVGTYLPPETTVDRSTLCKAVGKFSVHAPITILQGDHARPTDAKVVLDFDRYASDASRHLAAGLPRYHHTVGLASEVVPQILPARYELDGQALAASSLLLALGTRIALSGEDTSALGLEIIPAH